jgi:hypothetical protein
VRRITKLLAWIGTVCVLSAGLLGAGLVPRAGASTRVATGPKFAFDDPCTYPRRSVVKRSFGKPVTAATLSGASVCYLSLGPDPDVAPNARLAITREFPGNRDFTTAREQFEDKRAIENLSAFELADVFDLGLAVYSTLTTGAVTVLANKKFGFTLSWIPAGGAAITPREIKALERIAHDIVARSRD